MSKEVITVTNTDISEQAVSTLCEGLSRLNCRVYLEVDDQKINAGSLMGMILLAFKATYEQEITVSADGRDEEEAIKLVKGLFVKE